MCHVNLSVSSVKTYFGKPSLLQLHELVLSFKYERYRKLVQIYAWKKYLLLIYKQDKLPDYVLYVFVCLLQFILKYKIELLICSIWWLICAIRVSIRDPAKWKVENKQVKMAGRGQKHAN
jgi:hypothetical protein